MPRRYQICIAKSALTLIEKICSRSCSKSRPKSAKSPLPVDVHRSKTSLLKLPIFERRTSTGSGAFSFFISLDANKFVLQNFFSLIKTVYSRVSTKPLPNDAKSPLPVDVRRSKTSLLKLHNFSIATKPGNREKVLNKVL